MRTITVVEYDNEWLSKFKEEAEKIEQILGDNLLQSFHIGSTSVPGLKAKPIIDIMPVVRDIDKVDDCRNEFEKLGYEYMGEYGIPGRRFMRKGKDERSHHIHVFQYDNTDDITRHLAFREYLSHHKEVCHAYGEIKSMLAKKYPNDIDGYCLGKDEFVKQVERDALQWYWKTY